MLNLAAPPVDFTTNPFPHYDRLLRDAPVCAQPDGSFILSRHADLEAVYKDTARFISDKHAAFAPKFGAGTPLFEHHTTSLVFNDPPLHTRVRRIMAAALAPRAIQKMESGLIDTVDHLLNVMPQAPDLIEDFAAQIPIQIIGNLLGVPMDERGPLRDWSLAILGALEPVLTDAHLQRGHRAVTDFKAYLTGLIAQRSTHPGDPETDVLTRLINGDGQGQLTEIELIQNCIFILNAGHETTTNLIGSALNMLDLYPNARADLIANPNLIDTCIEEVLRFRSPNQFGNRETAQGVEIGGVSIPAGTNLHLCIGAANRDPAVFDAAEKFDITRKPNRHLAFAAGPHVCVGLTLARMEGRIAIAKFLARFPDYHVTARSPGGRIRFHGLARLDASLR